MRAPVLPPSTGRRALSFAVGAAVASSFFIAGAPLAGAQPPLPTAVKKAPPDGAARRAATELAQAKRLAVAVAKAHTPRARVRALTSVMRALGVGVVTARGRPLVVSVAKGAASDVQLYDFELKTLSAALGRGQEKSYSEVAAVLSSVGFMLSASQDFPPDLLHEAVSSAVRAGHRRGAHGYLLALLVQQLGLVRRMDPAGPTPTASIRLDALQAWLISADFAIGALRKLPSNAPRLTQARTANVADVCEAYRQAEEFAKKLLEAEYGKGGAAVDDKVDEKITDAVKEQLVRQGTRWAIRKLPGWAVRGAWYVGKGVNLATQMLKIIHGSLLALSVSVTTPDASLPEVHWGHDGPGGTLEFQEKVEMLDDYGDLAVKCGALIGLELPPKGPIKDVDVSWQQPQGDIKAEGALDCPAPAVPLIGKFLGGVICLTKTGEDGIARVHLTTNRELVPGVGPQIGNTGLMSGVALYQSAASGGITGFIGQFLFPKDGGGTRWSVSSHQCGGSIPATATASASAFRQAHASVFAPLTCGPIYAKIDVKVTERSTRVGCPDLTASSTLTGSTSALVPDTTDSTIGAGAATGADISIISPADDPVLACEPYTGPFSSVPYRIKASVTSDTMTVTWGPTDAVFTDPVPPDVAAAVNVLSVGEQLPLRDGTYEFEHDLIGAQAASFRHFTVTVAYSNSPL